MTTELGLEQLDNFAHRFWNDAGDKKIFAFHGAMGAGKTTIIIALCKAKGVTDIAGSPTFSIINEYAYVENGLQQQLFHIDLYRLKNGEEAVAAGVEEGLFSGAICFVEWPKIAPQLFDDAATHIVIVPLNDTVRVISILSATEFSAYRLKEDL